MTSGPAPPATAAGLALLAIIAPATPGSAQMIAPNPWVPADAPWVELPDGRGWGATSAVYPTRDGRGIWVAERCGANLCVGSDVDPVLLYDLDGTLVRSFGAGLFAWPHGMHVDGEGNVWVTDAVGYAPVPEGWGHVVYKFSPEGELLATLGRKGVPGDGPDTFQKPSDVYGAEVGPRTLRRYVRRR